MQIAHSVALVTGANRGIGRAFVEELLQRGARRVYAAARDVARATLSAVEAGEEDIFPDPMSRQIYSSWRDDHKAVERLFATM